MADRLVEAKLPVEGLFARTFTITEILGEPFDAELVLEGSAKIKCIDVKLDDLVGHEASVAVLREDGKKKRNFHGYVSEASLEDGVLIRLRIVPFLWLLSCASDIRIFQNKTVPEIVKEVISQHGFSGNVEDKLKGTYDKRVYCTQYRETDLNFVLRLLEDEGIYFYFRHESAKHHLVLCDSINAHAPAEGCDKLAYLPPAQGGSRKEHVSELSGYKAVVPGKVTLRDYFFAKASQKFESKVDKPKPHGENARELYDYPANFGFLGQGPGDKRAELRLQEAQVDYYSVDGSANASGVTCGALLKITGHSAEYDKEYLVTSTTCVFNSMAQRSGDSAVLTPIEISFEGLPSDVPYRPARNTPKPHVYGVHTAVVVGKKGEEIDVDEFGRVFVQFHWDRQGKKDEKSSVALRVSQGWAGTGFGLVFLPRIGQEVIVDFLEGDPDWPIITGRVFNSDNKHPGTLPDKKTVSGLMTRSTPQGGADNYNALAFEDKKGEELVYLQAEKDFHRLVKNDEVASVKHDRKMRIHNDEFLDVKNNRTRVVGKDEAVTIEGDRTVEIKGKETITVHKDQKVEIKENQDIKIGKTLVIDVGDEITIKTGESKLVMKSDGTITLDGKDFKGKMSMGLNLKSMTYKMEAQTSADMKAGVGLKVDGGATVDIKGGVSAKVEGGAKLDLSGGAMTTLKGGMVMIN